MVNILAFKAEDILFRMELDSIERQSSSFITVHKFLSIFVISFAGDFEHPIDKTISSEFGRLKTMVMIESQYFVILNPVDSFI